MSVAKPVSTLSHAEKIEEALRRSLPKLAPEAREEVAKLLEPEALAIMAGLVATWVAAHFVGFGEIVDVILAALGVLAIGLAVFDGIEHLFDFASGAISARSEAELDRAGGHFAQAVSILGITAVLAVLFRKAPKTFRGRPIDVGKSPAFARGWWMRLPPLRATEHMAATTGETSWWGEIVISRLGTAKDRRLAALHEAAHRFWTPRLALLRNLRINQRASSYIRSPLRKYLEEVFAETVGQVGTQGLRGAFGGLYFPVRNGYVTLMRPRLIRTRWVYPFLPEAAGLMAGTILIGDELFELWIGPRAPQPAPVEPMR